MLHVQADIIYVVIGLIRQGMKSTIYCTRGELDNYDYTVNAVKFCVCN